MDSEYGRRAQFDQLHRAVGVEFELFVVADSRLVAVLHCNTLAPRLLHRSVRLDMTWLPDMMVVAYHRQSSLALVQQKHVPVVVQQERWTMRMELVEK